MKENYEDIKSRITELPAWYDENGTPRYGEFSVDRCPNIYSNYVGLFLISCQRCDQRFTVEMSAGYFDSRSDIMPAKWHYGDPPIHGCVGDTMNCNDLRVIQFWIRTNGTWEHRPEFEGEIDGGWLPSS